MIAAVGITFLQEIKDGIPRYWHYGQYRLLKAQKTIRINYRIVFCVKAYYAAAFALSFPM
jgi:hypothetical protein